jgi:putative acyl-CoA dehydrogenase
MPTHDPIHTLRTHEVENQSRPLLDYDAWMSDVALREAVTREGGGWAEDRLGTLGREVGSEEMIDLGVQANVHSPQLRTFNRYGQRVDEVDFHPSYHELMRRAVAHEIPTLPWTETRPGGHVVHAAASFLFTQAEAGVMCPMTMTYAVVPALRHQPEIAATWLPRILEGQYDGRCLPASEKKGVTFGMAMTEKQGGSDVRTNTTRAVPLGPAGPGAEYHLTGHKWFCSAPMSDAFLTLAQSAGGLSCFLVPRFLPDGSRNRFFIQRLKDKLGNRSNASSEIEYDETWAQMVGPEGKGVRTIIDMVHHTRLDAALAPAAMMRQGLWQAINHVEHRKAFGKRLIEQPLMRAVLADLALEVEAAVMLGMRVARSFDESPGSPQAASFARIATAVTKYWLNKRAPQHIVESLECHGGAGYVEESPMPRLYREAPLNGIWEGSGNVICLDVLRAMHRDPGCLHALLAEIEPAAADEPRIAAQVDLLRRDLADTTSLEPRARRIVERMAVTLQAALLRQHAPTAVGDAFLVARLGADRSPLYGALPAGVDVDGLIERARPRPAA